MSKYQNGQTPHLNIKGFRKRRWAFGELECWGRGGGGWEAEDRCVIVCHRLFAWSFRAECHFNAHPLPSALQTIRFLLFPCAYSSKMQFQVSTENFVFVHNRMDWKENSFEWISPSQRKNWLQRTRNGISIMVVCDVSIPFS